MENLDERGMHSDVNQSNSPQKGFGIKTLAILAVFALILGSILAWFLSQYTGNNQKNNVANDKKAVVRSPLASNTLIYGYWTSESSIINSYDLSTRTNKILATLPSNIKHVKVKSPSEIVFINKTNDRDYGEELVLRSLSSSSDKVVFTATDGFGIDDYVLSQDGNYAAVWIVDPPAEEGPIRGGRSRVISLDLRSPQSTNLLYDEVSSSPVNYPVAVSNIGEVYTDKFLPNAEAGWGYGMSYSNFSGTIKKAIDSMPSGSYSTQPVMSPDGSKLVFSGYDGSKGGGDQVVRGFRRGVSNPNTVESLDLLSLDRTVLLSDGESIYPGTFWDLQTGDIIFSRISKNEEKTGTFIYDTRTKGETKFQLEDLDQPDEGVVNVISNLDPGKALVADVSPSDSMMGNLGAKYAQAFSTMFVMNLANSEKERIELDGELIQFIALKTAGYFPSRVGVAGGEGGQNNRQLKLQTLAIKPTLSSSRQEQQSSNRCRDVTAAQCNELHGTSFTGDQARQQTTGNEAFAKCFSEQFGANKAAGTCSDSPLYLYGSVGMNVKVAPGTTIYSPNASYSQNGFDITLNSKGFTANGTKVDSLSFDYTPAVKVKRPSRGFVVSTKELEKVVGEIGNRLGLNDLEMKETIDFVKAIDKSPYFYLSFFDHKTSQRILPLYFDPVPDNYRNIVFYIEGMEEMPNFSIVEPEFEKIQRGGFTAVEISFVVR